MMITTDEVRWRSIATRFVLYSCPVSLVVLFCFFFVKNATPRDTVPVPHQDTVLFCMVCVVGGWSRGGSLWGGSLGPGRRGPPPAPPLPPTGSEPQRHF